MTNFTEDKLFTTLLSYHQEAFSVAASITDTLEAAREQGMDKAVVSSINAAAKLEASGKLDDKVEKNKAFNEIVEGLNR